MATTEKRKDGVDPLVLLPIELWALIVANDDVGLEPRWRFAARPVCRLWRDLIDGALPCLCGWNSSIMFKGMWRVANQTLWARGRIVTASALVSMVVSAPRQWTPDRVARWVADAGGSDVDASCIMILSQASHLVDYALGTVLPRCFAPADLSPNTRRRRAESTIAASLRDPWHRLVEAAIRTGSSAIVDAACGRAPDNFLGTEMSLRAAAETGNVDVLERALASGTTFRDKPMVAMSWTRSKGTAMYIAAGLLRPMDREWALTSAHSWSPSGERQWHIQNAVERGNPHALDALASAGGEFDAGALTECVCHRRSIGGAQWLWERERAKGTDHARIFIVGLLRGAVLFSMDDDGQPCSNHPEGLLAWACDGPPRWDPLAQDADPCVSLRGLVEAASHPPHGEPHCFAWLCRRYPREVGAIDAIDEWTALAAQALFRPSHGSVSGISGMEQFVSAIEAVWTHMPRDRRTALEAAVDLWPLALSATPSHLDSGGARARVDHAAVRCRDDDPHKTAAAYAGCRAAAAYAEIGCDRVPFCVWWASTAAWRRWCRIPTADGTRSFARPA